MLLKNRKLECSMRVERDYGTNPDDDCGEPDELFSILTFTKKYDYNHGERKDLGFEKERLLLCKRHLRKWLLET